MHHTHPCAECGAAVLNLTSTHLSYPEACFCDGKRVLCSEHLISECDNCSTPIAPSADYLSDDRGIFCPACWCVGEPKRRAVA